MPSARVDFDSIDAAAVALLEPVLAAGPDWRGQLEAGLARLADAGRLAEYEAAEFEPVVDRLLDTLENC